MKLDRFGGWLALAANLGVVAGLIMLAIELRQNTQVIQAQAVANLMTGLASAETAFMGEDTAAAYVKVFNSPKKATGEEIAKVWAYLNVTIMTVQQTHSMYTLGIASEEAWGTALGWAIGAINFPFGRTWWNEANSIYPRDMVEEIDAALAKADPHLLQGMVERMRKSLMESPAN
jgi:hypothetical protein